MSFSFILWAVVFMLQATVGCHNANNSVQQVAAVEKKLDSLQKKPSESFPNYAWRISQPEMLNDLGRVIARPTVTQIESLQTFTKPVTRSFLDDIISIAKKLNLHVTQQNQVLHITDVKKNGGALFLLYGDVWPANYREWQVDPYALNAENNSNLLVGRGIRYNKGPLLELMYLLHAANAYGLKSKMPLHILVFMDGENLDVKAKDQIKKEIDQIQAAKIFAVSGMYPYTPAIPGYLTISVRSSAAAREFRVPHIRGFAGGYHPQGKAEVGELYVDKINARLTKDLQRTTLGIRGADCKFNPYKKSLTIVCTQTKDVNPIYMVSQIAMSRSWPEYPPRALADFVVSQLGPQILVQDLLGESASFYDGKLEPEIAYLKPQRNRHELSLRIWLKGDVNISELFAKLKQGFDIWKKKSSARSDLEMELADHQEFRVQERNSDATDLVVLDKVYQLSFGEDSKLIKDSGLMFKKTLASLHPKAIELGVEAFPQKDYRQINESISLDELEKQLKYYARIIESLQNN